MNELILFSDQFT